MDRSNRNPGSGDRVAIVTRSIVVRPDSDRPDRARVDARRSYAERGLVPFGHGIGPCAKCRPEGCEGRFIDIRRPIGFATVTNTPMRPGGRVGYRPDRDYPGIGCGSPTVSRSIGSATNPNGIAPSVPSPSQCLRPIDGRRYWEGARDQWAPIWEGSPW